MHRIEDIKTLFDRCFSSDFNTRLVKGHDEPIYLPAGYTDINIPARTYNQVVFAHGYYASALHEIAHWCLAGEARRKLVDFGYWYCPDGRTAEQQSAFQQVEIKPQAIEWGLCVACGFEFNVSCDNLSGDEFGQQPDRHAFQTEIHRQVMVYLKNGFPTRAQTLMAEMNKFYGTEKVSRLEQFSFQPPNQKCA